MDSEVWSSRSRWSSRCEDYCIPARVVSIDDEHQEATVQLTKSVCLSHCPLVWTHAKQWSRSLIYTEPFLQESKRPLPQSFSSWWKRVLYRGWLLRKTSTCMNRCFSAEEIDNEWSQNLMSKTYLMKISMVVVSWMILFVIDCILIPLDSWSNRFVKEQPKV